MNESSSIVKIIYASDVPQQDMRPIPWHCKFEGTEVGADCFCSVHWCMEQERRDEAPGVGHPPHMHKEREIMMLIGADPHNPDDLGGEVTMCVGEQMERITINKSCTIIIPGGTPHGNYRVVETTRPWLFVQIQDSPVRTEKFLWDYLTEEQIASIPNKDFWQDKGYE